MPIKSKIESLLFISAKPITAKQLSQLLKKEVKEVETAAKELADDYRERGGGLSIIKSGSAFQMVSAPESSTLVRDFIKDETTGELTRPSLETLTIIAYRGPISKLDLERIRGVNCSLIIHNLLLRGLVEARQDKKKNETYYNITFDFIRFLGINDVSQLPDYERLNKDDALDRILSDGKEANKFLISN
jgi:segregation and condensation protein B